MDKTEYDILLGEIRKIKGRIDDVDLALEQDRQNFQDFTLRLKGVEDQVEELRKASNQNIRKIGNTVEAVVAPVVESTDQLSAQIKKSKMVVLDNRKKKSWWQKLLEKR